MKSVSGISSVAGSSEEERFFCLEKAETLENIWDIEWKQTIADKAIATIKQRVSPRQFQIFDAYVVKGWSVKKVMTELGVSMAQVYLAKHRVGGLIKKEIAELAKQLI